MGCSPSIEVPEEDFAMGVVPGPLTLTSPAAASTRDLALPKSGSSPAKPAAVAPEADSEAPSPSGGWRSDLNSFPVPDGWRVVCRLSPGDARSRWGATPRRGGGAAGGGSKLEARLEKENSDLPLRLPLSLMQNWTEPTVGMKFAGRYEVKRALTKRPWASAGLFEVYDEQDKVRRALEVCTLTKQDEVKLFVGRLQLEALDTEQRLFMRLRDVALALPGKLGVIEDLPQANLYEEIGRCDSGNLSAVLAAAAASALDGLARLHANGWVLCSVSHQTLCLGLDGAWKLTGLQYARQADELVGATGWAGPILLPEALLHMGLTEKLDLWLLGASLAEAVMQRRIDSSEELPMTSADKRVQKLCQLVEFLGSLPEDLVYRHSEREALFTPEGQVLRPSTPGGDGMFEAIEPSDGFRLVPSGVAPRPALLEKALKGVEGGEDLLVFLGRLLQADPAKRPSASEALESQFLRVAKAKLEPAPSTPETSHPSPGSGNTSSKKKKEGVSMEEEAQTPEKTEAAKDDKKVKITADGGGGAAKGGGPMKVARKGTGFVNLNELPPSDEEDEDEEEEEEEEKPKAKAKAQAKKGVGFDAPQQASAAPGAAAGGSKKPVARKGTGFVNLNDLPDSDEEEEEEEEEEAKPAAKAKPSAKGVGFNAPAEQNKDKANKPQMKVARKGTGFVNLQDLPDSDEEEEEEEQPAKKGVQINASDSQGHDGDAAKKGGGAGSNSRKGTGFVNLNDIPDDDDDESGSEEEEAPQKKQLVIKDDRTEKSEEKKADVPAGKPARKGTGFVAVGEIPDDSEEESEEEEKETAKQPKKANFTEEATAAGAGQPKAGKKVARKGTGFVNLNELPESDDGSDDEEEEAASSKKPANKGGGVKFDQEAAEQAAAQPKAKAGAKPSRKGTGFVNLNDLPDSDDEEDDEEEEAPAAKPAEKKGVDFSSESKFEEKKQPAGKAASKPSRKGTGFVNTADLPDSDESEEEEEEAPAKPAAKKGVGFNQEAASTGDKQAAKPAAPKPGRKGTGFVNTADLPDSDESEEEEEEAASAPPAKPAGKKGGVGFSQEASSTGDKQEKQAAAKTASKPARKGTGFVNTADLPDSDESEEEEEEAKPAAPAKQAGKKGVGFSKEAQAQESQAQAKVAAAPSKPSRKGTGFVNMGDLPDSDDEDEDEDEPPAAAAKGKKAQFGAEVEDNSEKPAAAVKAARKGTGFVNPADIVDDSEDDEDED